MAEWMDIERLFEGFHGRDASRRTSSRWIERTFPSKLYLVGEALNIRYYSDKRDLNDPHGDGRVGVPKLFHHPFDGGVMLYDPIGAVGRAGDYSIQARWPKRVALLGSVAELAYAIGDSTSPSVESYKPDQLDLYAWEDQKTLMYFSEKTLNFGLIRGGKMVIESRGIVH